MTRVIVVEDHPLYRQAVCRLVTGIDGWTLAGEYVDAESALPHAGEADLVVLDLGLPGMSGITAVSRFKQANPALAVLVLTMSDEPATVAAALRAGAQGYLVKGSEPDDIDRAMVAAARGQAVFGAQVAETVLQQAASATRSPTRYPQLSEREHEVLGLLVAGRTNQQIAEALFISPKTARNQVSSILTKLGRTRAELIVEANRPLVGDPDSARSTSW